MKDVIKAVKPLIGDLDGSSGNMAAFLQVVDDLPDYWLFTLVAG